MFTMHWVGITEAKAVFANIAANHPERVKRALYTEALRIMAESKASYVPVDTGTLRASGYVDKPEMTAGRITVTLGYGGEARAYALIQHEAMDYKHDVGGPKYLERPVLENAHRVADAVRNSLVTL